MRTILGNYREKSMLSIKQAKLKIIKSRTRISRQEKVEKINETKISFFEKTNRINKPLAKLTKERREKEKEDTNYQYKK